jgi:hypothetical protein
VREPLSLQNVSLRVEGADALAVEGNYLRITTPLGDFALPLLAVEGADSKSEPAIQVVDGIHQVFAPFASVSPRTYDAFVAGLAATTDTFTRITTGDIVNDDGYSSGACWGDYDNDGHLDLFVTNWAGQNNFLYHNNGDGTLEKIASGSIVHDGGWSRSCTWGDYDNDGFVDLAVSDDGAGISLYHNEGGASFTRALDTPIARDYGNCYGISWADYDNDGWLDLFVARHTNADNLLYHSKGDGTFEKITSGAIVNDAGYSVPVSWGDYDADGCVDLFVGNVNYQPNFLYHNNCHGGFDKIAEGPIATDIGFSTTSNWVDYDNDGDLDLFVGNWYGDNFLYRNDGGGTFTRITTSPIVTDGTIHDSSWVDYDNDGDMDLFGGTPEGLRRFYQNNGDGTFARITTGTVVENSGTSGPNWADYDNDGDLDLFVASGDDTKTNFLYRNEGNANHWLHIKLIGVGAKQARTATGANKSAIGARVTVTAAINGRAVQQMQEVSGQTGLYSQNSPLVEFGLGDATVINSVSVRWPSGVVQVLTNMAVDQLLTIREPRRPLKLHYLPLALKATTAPPPAPLLVRYDFEGDFTASGTVLDRSGNGLNAQVIGAVASAPGVSGGQAISFDGDGYIQAASNPAAGRTDVTFSLWFKTDHPEENYKLASGAWWNWGPGSGWIMATHIPEFWSDDGRSLYLPGQTNKENHFPAGEWVHEVVTYDGSRIREYTNGQLINDWPTTGAAIGQGQPMIVGAWLPFTAYNFRGSIDEFQVFGRSLTAQEVQVLFDQGRG